jgi:succinyl-CoA synthetase beta subunit
LFGITTNLLWGGVMRIQEYQSKMMFARYGIPIPSGRVASTASEARQIAEELGVRVLVGGRGKSGGIRLAKSPKEAEELATIILGMEIKGLPVRKVLIDEAVSINKEFYLSITNDRATCRPVMIASEAGGIDIEEVVNQTPEKIIKVYIDPLLGLHDYQARDIAAGIDLPHAYWRTFSSIAQGLWRAFWESDATLAEINPLVITDDQKLIALDGKVILDDNALFRHPDQIEMRDQDVETPNELAARKYGLSYIKLDGQIGCMVNGAGLAMATMDIIKLFGGEPANFLDIGGGASADKVAVAFRLIMGDPNVKAVLINIFGGITRCDEVARGLLSVVNDIMPDIPIIVRLAGTNSEEGLRLLSDAQIITAETLTDAAQKAVSAGGGGLK